ncbi:MAG: cytochrome b5 domain-containing protein [Elusimicrobia bacterium]|nr:cytochrome b5 domain-containing protein [Elusimicrobiota bacterium]
MALRSLVRAAFVAFAAVAAAIGVAGYLSPRTAAPSGRAVAAAELARHATPADCWIAVDGGVYAVSAYLPEHPAPPGLIEPWCGKDASAPFRDKGGGPHSAAARAALETYRVGELR